MEDGAMQIGKRIQQRREKLGLTQEELADASGLRQSIISRLERGTRKNPSADTVRRLATTLGVTADWLIGMHEPDEMEQTPAAALPRTVRKS